MKTAADLPMGRSMNNTQQPPALPPALTTEQIALLARHASERAELDGRQHNERVRLLERQRAESLASSSPAPLAVQGASPAS
jgi:hypothetical protein